MLRVCGMTSAQFATLHAVSLDVVAAWQSDQVQPPDWVFAVLKTAYAEMMRAVDDLTRSARDRLAGESVQFQNPAEFEEHGWASRHVLELVYGHILCRIPSPDRAVIQRAVVPPLPVFGLCDDTDTAAHG
jgi:hypothetical protein